MITRRERCFVRSVWRHVAFQYESPRDGVASYATTPDHVTMWTTSSARERGMLHTFFTRTILMIIRHVHTLLRRCSDCGLRSLCHRSARRGCSQVVAIIGLRSDTHFARSTTPSPRCYSGITRLVMQALLHLPTV